MPILFKQLVAVLDNRTTFVCLKAAGQIQPLEDPFSTLNGEFDGPPFHISCRTIVAPYMTGFVNEQRAASNKELQRRPREQRDWRKGKNPPPPRGNPPKGGPKPKSGPPGPPAPAPSALDRMRKVADDVEAGAANALAKAMPDDEVAFMRRIMEDDEVEQRLVSAQIKALRKGYEGSVASEMRDLLDKGYFGTDDSFVINQMLRNEEKLTRRVTDMLEAARAWKAPTDLKTYRGVWDVDLGEKSLTGGIWRDKGFQSTTLVRGRAENWAMSRGENVTLFEVLIPKGTPIAVNVDQAEVLIPAGAQMRIVGDTTKTIVGRKVRVLRCVVEKI